MTKPKREKKHPPPKSATGATNSTTNLTFSQNYAQQDQTSWTKSKKKRMRKRLRQQENSKKANSSSSGGCDDESPSNEKDPVTKRESEGSAPSALKSVDSAPMLEGVSSVGGMPMSALQKSFLERLSGSRFRELNEELYTTASQSAYQRFSSNPVLFEQYHEGFRNQVRQWPINPVDLILRWLMSLQRKRRSGKKGTGRQQKLVVADFGCGDAKLARELLSVSSAAKDGTAKGKKRKRGGGGGKSGNGIDGQKRSAGGGDCPFVVHSFDLVSGGNPLVTPCDMSNVPLPDGSVDVGVFSLALMGTNIADFIREAHRVLRSDGILKIAEVRSRFESTSEADDGGNDDVRKGRQAGKSPKKIPPSLKRPDDRLLDEFLKVMEELGFQCTKKDRSNKMFVLMEFEKNGDEPSKDATFTAKPCIYKRR